MALHGSMKIDMWIKAPADQFHNVFSARPHHIPNASPEKIQACELHKGDWGNSGSVINWNYVHDGESKVAKEIVEEIDDEKSFTKFRVIDGDLMKRYKDFTLLVQATPMDDGSLVHWSLDYEKLNEDVPEPYTLLEFCAHITKDISSNLVAQAA
ncbi:hypothetical protein MLD38_004416 [Melastoma candidum]|uniref:Uncharacterized protein n=1 Tax=Melastoma candidum TaxID=119954 RepID=A0ACB9S7K7_9MYRT|nr:hypothetical protein MLD38_004416 [Melastoma candidum]